MSAVQVQDRIRFVEMHHFRGTACIACCLTLTDGTTVLGHATGEKGQPMDLQALHDAARANAERAVAALLQGD